MTLEFIAQIIEVFEDFLEERGIEIPNEEKAESDSPAPIYGSDFGELQSGIEDVLNAWRIVID